MKQDLRRVFRGELLVEISGKNVESLLNAALAQGVHLRAVTRLSADTISVRLLLADIYRLRYIARDHHCRIHIKSRRGLPFFLAFLRRRPLLPACAALGCLALAFLASLVNTVEVTSPYALAPADISRVRGLAEEAGLRENSSRWRMDLEAAEQYILDGFRELFYVEIFEHGSTLEIRVVKRVDVPEEEQPRGPGNIVAASAGVIQDVLVRRGTAAVRAGDTVKAGDILIYGVSGSVLLAADGIVNATVYAEGYGECPERQTIAEPTGNRTSAVALRLKGGASLTVLGRSSAPYQNYARHETVETMRLWRKIPLPVEVVFYEMTELTERTLSYTPQEARRLAEALAEQNACAALPKLDAAEQVGEIALLSEEIPLQDGIQRMRVVAQATMRIDAYRPLTEAEAAQYLAEGVKAPDEED